jgi:hypothetical protein
LPRVGDSLFTECWTDLIGFHTLVYSQHFIKSVKRTTGYGAPVFNLHPNKLVRLRFSHRDRLWTVQTGIVIGSVQQKTERFVNIARPETDFFGRSFGYTKVFYFLKGYEMFLEKCRKWRSAWV